MNRTILLAMVAAILMAACGEMTKKASGNAETESYDSLTIAIDSNGVNMTLRVDYPMQDTALQHALAMEVANKFFYTEDEEEVIMLPAYEGDFMAFLRACTLQRWRELEHDTYADFPEEAGEEDNILSRAEMRRKATEQGMALSSGEMTVTLQTNDSSSLTWKTFRYWHLYNTAHPSINEDSITLQKKLRGFSSKL